MPNVLIASLMILLVSTGVASADEFALSIKDHHFAPAELQVPAGKEFALTVTNDDATAEEFESDDFEAEKVIAGHQSVVIRMQPLDAGRYEFFGEYHEDTAKGALVAK
jgi:plastocyanin